METFGTIDFNDLFCDAFIKNFHETNFELISKVTYSLNNVAYFYKSKDVKKLCLTVKNELYPKFAEIFIPFVTTANGDCLWNMISLSLIGNESLTRVLRLLTALCMLLMKKSFIKLIKEQYESTHTPHAVNRAFIKFQEYIRIALTDAEWGSSYHLIALSTVLGKNIYIYSIFKNKNKFQLNKNIGMKNLDKYFKNQRTGSKIGHHLRYEPLFNNFFPKINVDVLYGFYDCHAAHYTALIPTKKQNAFVCRPSNCFSNLG